MTPTIMQIVKDNIATISFYRQGVVYYNVTVDGVTYVFPVPIDDLGGATLSAQEKAITLMRYIRKQVAPCGQSRTSK
jgi:hypothetical protein